MDNVPPEWLTAAGLRSQLDSEIGQRFLVFSTDVARCWCKASLGEPGAGDSALLAIPEMSVLQNMACTKQYHTGTRKFGEGRRISSSGLTLRPSSSYHAIGCKIEVIRDVGMLKGGAGKLGKRKHNKCRQHDVFCFSLHSAWATSSDSTISAGASYRVTVWIVRGSALNSVDSKLQPPPLFQTPAETTLQTSCHFTHDLGGLQKFPILFAEAPWLCGVAEDSQVDVECAFVQAFGLAKDVELSACAGQVRGPAPGGRVAVDFGIPHGIKSVNASKLKPLAPALGLALTADCLTTWDGDFGFERQFFVADHAHQACTSKLEQMSKFLLCAGDKLSDATPERAWHETLMMFSPQSVLDATSLSALRRAIHPEALQIASFEDTARR